MDSLNKLIITFISVLILIVWPKSSITTSELTTFPITKIMFNLSKISILIDAIFEGDMIRLSESFGLNSNDFAML